MQKQFEGQQTSQISEWYRVDKLVNAKDIFTIEIGLNRYMTENRKFGEWFSISDARISVLN